MGHLQAVFDGISLLADKIAMHLPQVDFLGLTTAQLVILALTFIILGNIKQKTRRILFWMTALIVIPWYFGIWPQLTQCFLGLLQNFQKNLA